MYTLHQWNEKGHQYEGQNTSGSTWGKKTNKPFFSLDEKQSKPKDFICMCVHGTNDTTEYRQSSG